MLSPRPWVVPSKYVARNVVVAVLCLLGALGCIGGGTWWIVRTASRIAHDQRLWATGHEAYAVRIGGTSTSHSFVINDYDLDVHYTDEQQRPHDGKAGFALLVSSVDDNDPGDVKYDPAHPDDFVVSWAITHLVARWACALFLSSTFIVLFGAGLFVIAGRRLRLVTDAKKVAARSDEVLLELVSVSPVVVKRKHIANVFRYRHTVYGRVRVLEQRLAVAELPLYSGDERTHLVALVSSHIPHRPWLMRQDHAPFAGTGLPG